MSEVSALVVRAAFRAADLVGIDTSPLIQALRVEPSELRSPLDRLPWRNFAGFADALLEQLEAHPGGLQEFSTVFQREEPLLAGLAASALPPRRFFECQLRMGEWAMPNLSLEMVDLAPGRLAFTITIPDDAEDSPAFFQISQATLEAALVHAHPGSGPVEMHHSSRRGEFVAHYSEDTPPLEHFKRSFELFREAALSRIAVLEDEIRALRSGRSGGQSELAVRLSRAAREWKLSRRQAEVLGELVRGASNREVAQALGCAERTAEIHITAILRKAGVFSRAQLIATFWSRS